MQSCAECWAWAGFRREESCSFGDGEGATTHDNMNIAKKSAGLLLFRRQGPGLEVLLVHPGGPFWTRKDEGAWSIPKGEFQDEEPLQAAIREFNEETGMMPTGRFIDLGALKQAGGKTVYAWGLEADFDPANLRSNTFTLEWPKGSGLLREFPEVDRAGWFALSEARKKLLKGQAPFLEELERKLARSDAS